MDKEVSKILESIVKFNMSKGNPTSRSLLGKLRGEIDPQPTYGTKTAIGIDLTRFCEDMAKKYGLKYVKDANGRNARLEA
jgi:hypothetical protein